MSPLFPPPSDVHLHVGSGSGSSQQHTATGLLCPLHRPSVQGRVPGVRPARVYLQRLLDVDGVQVEAHQRTHIPGGQSRTGGEPRPLHFSGVKDSDAQIYLLRRAHAVFAAGI